MTGCKSTAGASQRAYGTSEMRSAPLKATLSAEAELDTPCGKKMLRLLIAIGRAPAACAVATGGSSPSLGRDSTFFAGCSKLAICRAVGYSNTSVLGSTVCEVLYCCS